MIPFIDLKAQQALIRKDLDDSIARILDHGAYIMGPEVTELEEQLSAFCGAKYTISCSSGTDALSLYLMAQGVGAGDAVFVPAFTFAATAEVVSLVGATPVFVDICVGTFNMCADSLTKAIAVARKDGLKPVGVMTVDLFGQPADYDAIEPVCAENNLWLLSDAAQSFGASYKGRKLGTIGHATATSFFPAKPLGCYGDGGAIFTDDEDLVTILRSLRVHGQGSHKYENVRIGLTARMDTIQAAVLLHKLKIFPDELVARQKVADRYTAALSDIVKTPVLADGSTSSWAQYTVCLPCKTMRPAVQEQLKDMGVPTMVYYPIPLHHQKGYAHYPKAEDCLKNAEDFAHTVMSLPMHSYLDEATQDTIIAHVRSVVETQKNIAA